MMRQNTVLACMLAFLLFAASAQAQDLRREAMNAIDELGFSNFIIQIANVPYRQQDGSILNPLAVMMIARSDLPLKLEKRGIKSIELYRFRQICKDAQNTYIAAIGKSALNIEPELFIIRLMAFKKGIFSNKEFDKSFLFDLKKGCSEKAVSWEKK